MQAVRTKVAVLSFCLIFITSAVFAEWKDDAKVVKISGGEDHTLILTADTSVWGAGLNFDYQLGLGDGNNINQRLLTRVHGPSDVGFLEDISDIAAGWLHSLALEPTYGYVFAWGNNEEGQLGNNRPGPPYYSSTPVKVLAGQQNPSNPNSPLQGIIAISAGRSGEHSLAISSDGGLVYSWGRNYDGELGNNESGTGARELTPVKVHGGEMGTAYLQDIIAISGGRNHSMAVDADGGTFCWGSNEYGKLGGSGAGLEKTPIKVHEGEQQSSSIYLENIVTVSAGWDHSIALEKYDPFDTNFRGRVFTWGHNGSGQLGNYSGSDSNIPVIVHAGEENPGAPNSDLEGIIAISAGQDYSMALDHTGQVWTWGTNSHGELSTNSTNSSNRPVKALKADGTPLNNIVAISAGYCHGLAIDTQGRLYTWGQGTVGAHALGDWQNKRGAYLRGVVYNLTQQTYNFGIDPAVNAANNTGDTLEASPGTYFEDFSFLGKALVLRSSDPNNWDIIEDTVIKSSGFNGYVVYFNNNNGSTLNGFKITTGNNLRGVYSVSSSPLIKNCIIERCWPGIDVSNSTAQIDNCKIIDGNDGEGIYSSGSDICVNNCLIESNPGQGIYASGSDLNVTNTVIQGNGTGGSYDGIYFNGQDLTIRNSIIKNNTQHGIYNYSASASITNNKISENSSVGIYCGTGNGTSIKNNWIFANGSDSAGHGIYIYYAESPLIRNNTIIDNAGCGVRAQYQGDVFASNCIVWGNDAGELYYCAHGYSYFDDPGFVDASGHNYHLAPGASTCKNTGDPAANYAGETDIDGEERVMDGRVDIGADEYGECEVDFNFDGVVNFYDYALFAAKWQTEDGDPGFDETYDLNADDIVDFDDLDIFVQHWLWIGGWTELEGLMIDRGLGVEVSVVSESVLEKAEMMEEPIDSGELLKWLEELWLTGDLKEVMTEEEFYEFMKLLYSAAE